MTPLIVAIDGPAGAGKSTVSKILARRLGFALVDTGAIYRCVALEAGRRKIPLDDDERLGALLDGLEIGFKVEGDQNRVFVQGVDVTTEIRTPDNSLAASQVSARPVVRAGLLELQRRLALGASKGAILEGRDIGTVVFPEAEVKVFLFADPKVRARRRYEELFTKGAEKPLAKVEEEQNKRDKDDSEREVAPLKPAADSVQIDSSQLELSMVVERIESLVRSALAKRAAQPR